MSIRAMSWRLRLLIGVLTLVVVSSVVVGVAVMRNHHTSSDAASLHQKPAGEATVIIERGQDSFAPFILPVMPGTIVTWKNEDDAVHTFRTTPDKQSFLNPQSFSFMVQAGQQVAFRFTRPGIYHYYETTKGTWNATFSRVAANNGLRHYPLSMEGVIWVEGAIPGLPLSAYNYVVAGHDMFAHEFQAIAVKGAVTWHNLDSDPHFVGPVAGWSPPVNPVDMGLYRLAGTDDVPGGESVSVIFTTPGLYYYYCRNHDLVDPRTNRVQARTMASEYPIPMEGFVLVA
jgi:plastocyanin